MWEKFPRGKTPPPSPSMGIFSMKYRFFLKMSQNKIFYNSKICFLALQDDFGMQKKLGKTNINKWEWVRPPPLPQYGNFFDEMPFFSEDVPKQKNFKIVKYVF